MSSRVRTQNTSSEDGLSTAMFMVLFLPRPLQGRSDAKYCPLANKERENPGNSCFFFENCRALEEMKVSGTLTF